MSRGGVLSLLGVSRTGVLSLKGVSTEEFLSVGCVEGRGSLFRVCLGKGFLSRVC